MESPQRELGLFMRPLLIIFQKDIFEGSQKEVVLPASDQLAEPRKVKVFWRTIYAGSQRVFQLFDDAGRPEETKKRVSVYQQKKSSLSFPPQNNNKNNNNNK